MRVKGFVKILVRSRMALTGMILLGIFIFFAAAAPVLTPYRPQGDVVSGPRDPPAWISHFVGNTGLSQNAQFSGITGPNIASSGMDVRYSILSSDSVILNVTSATGGEVTVTETLNYPYAGPPSRFIGSVYVTPKLPTGQIAFVNASFYSYINGQREGNWTLWEQSVNITQRNGPSNGIDSNGVALAVSGSSLNPAQIIFSTKALYDYVLEITVPAGTSSFLVQNFHMNLFGNSWGLLGTDDGGFDIWSQFVYGAQLSLLVGLTATFIGIGLGLLVGLLAGYLGKLVDEILMRFTDMMLVIPTLPLLIVLVAVLGASLFNVIIVLGFLGWMGFARLIRSQVLSIRERPYIEAAKAAGAGTGYITVRHIFPNIVSLTYVNLALSVPAAIVGEAALSFLGLSDSSTITWGRMLQFFAEAGGTSQIYWWWILPPGIGIAVLSLAFILLGFAMDEIFNPRLRKRR
jgi:peptide/nickel transport system permease protein